jgi:hypothetical protein
MHNNSLIQGKNKNHNIQTKKNKCKQEQRVITLFIIEYNLLKYLLMDVKHEKALQCRTRIFNCKSGCR